MHVHRSVHHVTSSILKLDVHVYPIQTEHYNKAVKFHATDIHYNPVNSQVVNTHSRLTADRNGEYNLRGSIKKLTRLPNRCSESANMHLVLQPALSQTVSVVRKHKIKEETCCIHLVLVSISNTLGSPCYIQSLNDQHAFQCYS